MRRRSFATARGFEAEYDRLNVHDDQFDAADAMISIAVRRRRRWRRLPKAGGW